MAKCLHCYIMDFLDEIDGDLDFDSCIFAMAQSMVQLIWWLPEDAREVGFAKALNLVAELHRGLEQQNDAEDPAEDPDGDDAGGEEPSHFH
jgi:hypothetical protein